MGPHGPCSIAPSMPTRSGRASPHPSRRPLAPGCAPVWKRGTLPFANGLSFWCRTLTGTRSRTWSVSPSRCRSRGMSGARERGSSDDFGARRKRPVGSNFLPDPLPPAPRTRSELRLGRWHFLFHLEVGWSKVKLMSDCDVCEDKRIKKTVLVL